MGGLVQVCESTQIAQPHRPVMPFVSPWHQADEFGLSRKRRLAASRRIVPAGADETPADENHGDSSHGEKADVPHRLPKPLDDVVNPEEVVVNDALDEIEDAEAQDERAEEGPR